MNIIYIVNRIYSKLKLYRYLILDKRVLITKDCDITGLKLRISKDNGIVKFGRNFGCRDGVIFNVTSGELLIGDDVSINDRCIINVHKRIVIGQNTMIGQNVLMYDHDHDYTDLDHIRTSFLENEIVIGKNVWIGSNVVILRGTHIGDNCVIGAGTVLKKDIPNNMIVYNNSVLTMKVRGGPLK